MHGAREPFGRLERIEEICGRPSCSQDELLFPGQLGHALREERANEGLSPARVAPPGEDVQSTLEEDPMTPVAYTYRLTAAELRRVTDLTFEQRAAFLERWNEHFHR
jgi:hypothetical protein